MTAVERHKLTAGLGVDTIDVPIKHDIPRQNPIDANVAGDEFCKITFYTVPAPDDGPCSQSSFNRNEADTRDLQLVIHVDLAPVYWTTIMRK